MAECSIDRVERFVKKGYKVEFCELAPWTPLKKHLVIISRDDDTSDDSYGKYHASYINLVNDDPENLEWFRQRNYEVLAILESSKKKKLLFQHDSPKIKKWDCILKYAFLSVKEKSKPVYKWNNFFFYQGKNIYVGVMDFEFEMGVVMTYQVNNQNCGHEFLGHLTLSDDSVRLGAYDNWEFSDGETFEDWSRKLRPKWNSNITSRKLDDSFAELDGLIGRKRESIPARYIRTDEYVGYGGKTCRYDKISKAYLEWKL